eukprot:m.1096696 g.1096696  ORF g.1096696 m.1096696 type:complete len:50 (-) comp24310_c0_seq4:5401-5550(-)
MRDGSALVTTRVPDAGDGIIVGAVACVFSAPPTLHVAAAGVLSPASPAR